MTTTTAPDPSRPRPTYRHSLAGCASPGTETGGDACARGGRRVAPTAPAAATPAVRATPRGEDLTARVVALVAEQTGYPPELLDLDLDLEADLGIDTVKQAELFAQVRETYGIARDDSLKLRDYPTLNHVIGFVRDRTARRRRPRRDAAASRGRRRLAVATPRWHRPNRRTTG